MKRNFKKVISVILAFIMLMSLIPTMASAAPSLGTIDGIEIRKKVVLSIGESYNLTKPANAHHLEAYRYTDNYAPVETVCDESGFVAQKLVARREGVALILVTATRFFTVEEEFFHGREIVDEYWLIVIVKPNGKTVNDMGKVTGISMEDITSNYKNNYYVYPDVETYGDRNAYYCTYFVCDSYEDAPYIDDVGCIRAYETGKSNVTCYVIDAQGNIFSTDFTLTVKYSFIQWIINYLLFGWLWGF